MTVDESQNDVWISLSAQGIEVPPQGVDDDSIFKKFLERTRKSLAELVSKRDVAQALVNKLNLSLQGFDTDGDFKLPPRVRHFTR